MNSIFLVLELQRKDEGDDSRVTAEIMAPFKLCYVYNMRQRSGRYAIAPLQVTLHSSAAGAAAAGAYVEADDKEELVDDDNGGDALSLQGAISNNKCWLLQKTGLKVLKM